MNKDEIKAGAKYQKFIGFNALDAVAMKELGDDLPDGYVAGWASTTDMDRSRDVIVAGAFDEAISKKGLDGPEGIKFFLSHNSRQPLGTIKKLETRNGNLWIEAQMNLEISYAKDAYLAAKINGGMNFSVGFSLQDYAFKEDASGREFLQIDKGDLFEVSLVTIPDNEKAHMTFIKGENSNDDLDGDGGTTVIADIDVLPKFEKALVADGIVDSRNKASKITAYVKQYPDLFIKSPAPVVEEKPASTVSGKSLKRIRELTKEMELTLKS